MIMGVHALQDVPLQAPPTLFGSTYEFVREALVLHYGFGLDGSIHGPRPATRRFCRSSRLMICNGVFGRCRRVTCRAEINERLQLTGDAELAEGKLAEALNDGFVVARSGCCRRCIR